jgi:CxxC motif-containing protein (DUF1111 family)
MRQKNLLLLGLFAVPLMQPLGSPNGVNSQDIMPAIAQSPGRDSTEAPTGFDNLTNGLTDQAVFEADRRVFEESETIEDGLGPVYNARACAECHSNPVIGGNSQISELRVGYFDGKRFVEHPGGSLIQQRAIDPESFARFIRATKAPPRDAELAATPDAQAGEQIFQQIGCAICHVPTIVTARPGTVINGGAFTVPEVLGNKIIHPFSDFLLHDVGSGDGIVQNGGQETRNKIRTAPLWGLRTRPRFMHDGLSLTPTDAILRHAREALGVIDQYRALSTTEKDQLLAFLQSL